MNKKSKLIIIFSLIILFIGLASALIWAYMSGYLSFKPDPSIVPQKIKITNINYDRFTISWITESKTQGSIIYGNSDKLDQVQIDDRDQLTGENNQYFTHHITISNLQPATSYQFKISTTEKKKLFDNNGNPFSIKTAPKLVNQPASDLVNGTILNANGSPASGSIVYLSLPGISPLSTQVKKDGSWLLNLSTAYNEKLTDYIKYDKELDKMDILVQGETSVSKAITTTANKSPVPPITLGETYDFTSDQLADSSEKENSSDENIPTQNTNATDAQLPEVFLQDFDAFSDDSDIDGLSNDNSASYISNDSSAVTITNPQYENEELNTLRPEFLGTGPTNSLLTIRIVSVATLRGTTFVDSEGFWKYSPKEDLKPGTHTIELDFTNASGEKETISRKFVVTEPNGKNGTSKSITPAFESTPSAVVESTPTPTPTPRAAMPDTSDGTPVSGSASQTALLLVMGIILLGGGVYAKKTMASGPRE